MIILSISKMNLSAPREFKQIQALRVLAINQNDIGPTQEICLPGKILISRNGRPKERQTKVGKATINELCAQAAAVKKQIKQI